MSRLIFAASDLVYGPWTIALLFGIGLYLTLRYRLVQLAHWREVLASMRRAPSAGGGVLSPFQAFMTALAASIGTGNIAGVATAIVSGGPGAIFWIWCYGCLRDRDQVQRGGARHPLPRGSATGGSPRVRCTTCATASGCRGSAGSTR